MAVTENSQLRDAAQALVDYCVNHGLQKAADRVWSYNAVLECAGALGPAPDVNWVLAEATPATDDAFDLDAALLAIAEAAVANGVADDTASGRDRVACRVMGLLMPKPSQVADEFARLAAADGPMAATDWFYRLCCDAGYVRRSAIARNIEWSTPTQWGNLEITINLSKPEKDPREIAAAGAAKDTGEKYPACQLCIENEGYPGRAASAAGSAHPARQNLRIIPIELGGERWGLQYSPYAYFNEHCIAMSSHHRPMHIDRAALACLLDFVDTVPGYFIGSNADLPIVGGSILSHDHFQGGAHEFPMMRAEVVSEFAMDGFADVTGAVLRWPLSVVRLRSANRDSLLDAATHVIDAWRAWSDESVGVVAHDADGTPHNTVTPVVRRVDSAGHVGGDGYEVYLALRCNVTSDEHPLGVFHPHAEYHHIKKENIGLIEVMGLAILPARLVGELAAVRDHLLAGDVAGLADDAPCASHAAWAADVYERRGAELTADNATRILHEEVGAVFGHVLEDAGVFKWDQEGRAACDRFVASL
ncbi:UDP-glucose--hexose-1-phosphate uridylyltransferase [Atopobiaceae bacterium Sow4_H2]